VNATSTVLYVRESRVQPVWHLVAGPPGGNALCGAGRPRRGWYDVDRVDPTGGNGLWYVCTTCQARLRREGE
jgi:hypothetical protein